MAGEKPDEDLMVSIASGNQAAFRILVDRHVHRAHAIAMRTLLQTQDAEEAVQDAFCKVWVNAASFDGSRARFSTWFYRILVNTCLDKIRARPAAHADIRNMEELLPDGQAGQDIAFIVKAESVLIMNAVKKLPDRQRIAVVLCYFDGMTNPQAAAALGIHVKALEGLLVRARRQLKEWLGESYHE